MDAPPGCDEEERDLFVSPRQFETQMADLARRGFRTTSLSSLSQTDAKTVLITFDDAYAHVGQVVTPVLQRYGFSAVMFAPLAHLGERNVWDARAHPRLGTLQIASAGQIEAMVNGPWEIGSHGYRHLDLRMLDASELREQLTQSRARLSRLAGKPVDALAYPFGYVDSVVERAARQAGYLMGFVDGPGVDGNPMRLARTPIRGSDDLAVFRLKTSSWLRRLRPVHRVAPDWARMAVRTAINRVT